MSYLNKKGESFDPADDAIPVGRLNALRDGMPRQLRGGNGITVQQFGDRLVISGESDGRPVTPDPGNYYARFVVRREYDDYLLCAPFRQPVDGTTHSWVPQGYDKDLGATAEVFVYVAKPSFLQKSVWNTKTAVVNGSNLTVGFDGVTIGQRTVTDTGGSVQTQRIAPLYMPGDVICARRSLTGLTSPNGQLVMWADENEAARQWVTTGITGTPTTSGALFAGPVNPLVLSGINQAKYESWWRDTTAGAFYLAGGDRTTSLATGIAVPDSSIAFALPFLVARDCTVTGLAYRVTAGVAGAKLRLGIYSDAGIDGNYIPDSLLFDSGEIDASVASPGSPAFATVSCSVAATAYSLLWIVLYGNPQQPVVAMRDIYDCWPIKGQFNYLDNVWVGVGAQPTHGTFPALPATFDFGFGQFDISSLNSGFTHVPVIGVGMTY